jgi:hypothetical protein
MLHPLLLNIRIRFIKQLLIHQNWKRI